jgi:MFS family permease
MVAGLSVTVLISWGVLVYAFAVLVVPMHADLGMSPVALNGAYTTGVVVCGIVGIPVGRWLQRHGARALMTAGSLLAVAGLLSWSQVRTLPEFYITFCLLGLAMAATLYEPAFAVTAAWFRHRRAHAVLVLTIAGGLSSTVFSPLTSALVTGHGWRTALITLAVIVAVVTVPIHALLLRHRPADLGLRPDGTSTADGASPPGLVKTTGAPAPPARAGAEPHHDKPARHLRSLWWIIASMTAHTAAKVAISVILVAYITSRGYSLSEAALAAGGIGLFQVVGRVATTALRHRIPEHRSAIALFIAQGLSLPVPLLTTGHGPSATISILVLVVFFGLGYGLSDLLRGTLVADYYGPDRFARLNGIISTFVYAARAAGPLLAGLAITALHTDAQVFIAAGILVLTSGYALHCGHREHNRELRPGNVAIARA